MKHQVEGSAKVRALLDLYDGSGFQGVRGSSRAEVLDTRPVKKKKKKKEKLWRRLSFKA
jgi:hypothetical protein